MQFLHLLYSLSMYNFAQSCTSVMEETNNVEFRGVLYREQVLYFLYPEHSKKTTMNNFTFSAKQLTMKTQEQVSTVASAHTLQSQRFYIQSTPFNCLNLFCINNKILKIA